MIRKIVAPVDGSAASERIIPHIAELRRAVDAEVTLVHVVGSGSQAEQRGREYLESLHRRGAGLIPDAKFVLRIGEPAFEILKYAAFRRADLIALTTRGGSAVRRVIFGNTAIELLRSSRIPLFIARPEFHARPFRRILAAIEGSRVSRATLESVMSLARPGETDVVLVRTLLGGEAPERAAASLVRLAGNMNAKGIRIETLMTSGDPARSIVQSALDYRAELVALGTHGCRGTDRFFFGSVAESVLLASQVPVLLHRTVRVPRLPRRRVQGARA